MHRKRRLLHCKMRLFLSNFPITMCLGLKRRRSEIGLSQHALQEKFAFLVVRQSSEQLDCWKVDQGCRNLVTFTFTPAAARFIWRCLSRPFHPQNAQLAKPVCIRQNRYDIACNCTIRNGWSDHQHFNVVRWWLQIANLSTEPASNASIVGSREFNFFRISRFQYEETQFLIYLQLEPQNFEWARRAVVL